MGNRHVDTSIQFNQQTWRKCPTVGAGAFGKVFVVENSGQYRCLKEISKHMLLSKSDSSLTLLLQERAFLTELRDCPFVVRVHGTIQDKDYLYMMMDYCEGGELFWHLNLQPKKKFSEEVAKFYLAELIISLKAMHKQFHIVHRDIKPQNLLLTKAGHLVLIDFNVAGRCNEEGVVQNPEKKKIGTPSYMAPEMLSGQETHSTAIDWWSVGVVIYQLVHGTTPWQVKKEQKPQPNNNKGNNHVDEKERTKEYLSQIEEFPIESKLKNCPSGLKAIIKGFCDPNPTTRLNGDTCQKHEYFAGWDWSKTRERELTPPFTPGSKTFDESLCVDEALSGPKPKLAPLSTDQQSKFKDWDWMNEEKKANEGQS